MEVQESKKNFCKYCSPKDKDGDITSEIIINSKVKIPFGLAIEYCPEVDPVFACEEVKRSKINTGEDFVFPILVDVSLETESKTLHVGLQSGFDGSYKSTKQKINYCPMCGRKL